VLFGFVLVVKMRSDIELVCYVLLQQYFTQYLMTLKIKAVPFCCWVCFGLFCQYRSFRRVLVFFPCLFEERNIAEPCVNLAIQSTAVFNLMMLLSHILPYWKEAAWTHIESTVLPTSMELRKLKILDLIL